MVLYGVPIGDLLNKVNYGLKNLLIDKDIFADEIKISHLKRIDKIFNKGLAYYFDPKNPIESKEESIFFRKDNFNANLNLGARQIVNRFEEEKIAFSTLAKLSDFKLKRIISFYKITDKPETVASEARKRLYPSFVADKKDFLKNFISKLAESNILVFEFIETYNKKEKANINGFFLNPNVIVLKRNQKSFRREIYTLAHELGHYLLNEEEIDENINEQELNSLNQIERWCNDFAYFFLMGDYNKKFESLGAASKTNHFHSDLIEKISNLTHLSSVALYTRLLLNNQISAIDYKAKLKEILESIREWELNEKTRLELEKQNARDEGRKLQASTPKPIISPLYSNILKSALLNGLINESEFCKKLNLNPEKLVNIYESNF